MCLCRRSALWAGCVILVLVYLAAEKLADATSAAETIVAPVEAEYPEDSSWVDAQIASADLQAHAELCELGTEAAYSATPAVNETCRQEPLPPAPQNSASRKGGGKSVNRICRVTAYCDRGLTAAGIPSGVGQCAAPVDIPLGSTVYIPALQRSFVVTDRTHRRFRHNTVDLFIPSEKQCRKFGRRYLECEFSVVKEPVGYGKLRIAQGG